MVEPELPTIECPTETIDETYAFGWMAGSYDKKVRIQFADNPELKKPLVLWANESPTEIAAKYKKLVKKQGNGTLYARILGIDPYNRQGYSGTCNFEIA